MLDFLELFVDSVTGSAEMNRWLKDKDWFKDHPFLTKLISYIAFPISLLIIGIIVLNIYRLVFL